MEGGRGQSRLPGCRSRHSCSCPLSAGLHRTKEQQAGCSGFSVQVPGPFNHRLSWSPALMCAPGEQEPAESHQGSECYWKAPNCQQKSRQSIKPLSVIRRTWKAQGREWETDRQTDRQVAGEGLSCVFHRQDEVGAQG